MTMNKNFAEDLKKRAQALNGGVKLAVGRTKEENIPMKEHVTLDNYEFATGNVDGETTEFVAFTLKEYPDKFYFGGSVVTKNLSEFTEDDLKFIQENGIPVMFEKVKSKVRGHQDYTKIIFYPEEL